VTIIVTGFGIGAYDNQIESSGPARSRRSRSRSGRASRCSTS
jgi:hypothetical protein